MKNLTKILLLTGALSSPFVSLKAQEKEVEGPRASAYSFLALHKSANDGIIDGFGDLFKGGLGFSANVLRSLRIGGRLGFISEEVKDSDQFYDEFYRYNMSWTDYLSIMEISALVDYLVPAGRGNYYIGGGPSIISLTEEIKGKVSAHEDRGNYYDPIPESTTKFSDTTTETALGLALLAGREINIVKDTQLFFEANARFAGSDLGGYAFKVGIRYDL